MLLTPSKYRQDKWGIQNWDREENKPVYGRLLTPTKHKQKEAVYLILNEPKKFYNTERNMLLKKKRNGLKNINKLEAQIQFP